MTDAKFDDFNGDGKVIKKDLAYKVDIYSIGNKCHIEGDMSFEVPLKTIVQSFVKNGCNWYELKKIDDKWQRLAVADPHQEKLDSK